MEAQWDIVIAGGGLSGLAMAVELAQPQFSHLRILLVEQRSVYRRDRTWSFWSDGAHRYAHLERAAWTRWRVAHDGSDAVRSGSAAYRTIDADAFYADALAQIAACSHIEVRLGTAVASVSAQGPCRVQLGGEGGGQWLQTGLLIDARPPSAAAGAGSARMAQHFLGWEIETDVDLFDPSTLDLMDFRPACDGLHFFYVLPYGPRRALVETTWISPPGLHHDYAAQLERYIAQRWGRVAYRKVYEERGSLGLDPVAAAGAQDGPIVRVGRAAGTLRPSTGFAFLETLAHCTQLAQQIGQCRFPITGRGSREPLRAFRRKAADRWMDALFQRFLEADWPSAPALFLAMFRHAPSDRLIRFLCGQASWLDRIAVVASMPKLRCLHSLVRPRGPAAALVSDKVGTGSAGSRA
jgi:lycopene beta-cyclase